MRVVFRVDSAAHIGNGHLFRCLALAQVLRKNGCDCHFICRQLRGAALKKVVDKKFALSLLHMQRQRNRSRPYRSQQHHSQQYPSHLLPNSGDYTTWLGVTQAQDARETSDLLSNMQAVDWLIVDNYALDAQWHQVLRKQGVAILVIDDLANRPYNCDLLLDQTFGRANADYANWVPEESRLLLGSTYALLNHQFSRKRRAARQRRLATTRIARLLISLGGANAESITHRALKGLERIASQLPCLQIDIVLPLNCDSGQAVQSLAKSMMQNFETLQINILIDVEDMAALMVQADLAIGAAGTTSWERCCLGLPTIVLVTGSDQHTVAQQLSQQGAAINLGWYEDVGPQPMAQAIVKIFGAMPSWHAMSCAAFKLCDGDGANRVAKSMLQSCAMARIG